ncbi:MAG TPA: TadE/TadG family type IV pilus assembly protein [Alphaproteobacteria bacterium]|jgi:Flp pilus assembly protein TadG|nr:TadE/TadG family type IV pilus assembly protein [Alphaproteobacteria bacterium]
MFRDARDISGLLQQFRRSQEGVAAVEFAFVAPILILIVAGIIQFGAVFFLQGNMGNAAREISRSLAVGAIGTQTEAEALADSRLTNWGIDFDVAVQFPDPSDPNDTDYTVTVSAPLSEAAIFDILGVFEGTLTATASMRKE